jgi:hypothetical protein
MSKLLLKNLKLEDKELVISTYFEKTKYLDISKIKLMYFRKNKFRYFYCALLVVFILFLINSMNKHFDILITLIIGGTIIYLSMNVFSELIENTILVIKEIDNTQNKIIVLKNKKTAAKKIVATIKNFKYQNKMKN